MPGSHLASTGYWTEYWASSVLGQLSTGPDHGRGRAGGEHHSGRGRLTYRLPARKQAENAARANGQAGRSKQGSTTDHGRGPYSGKSLRWPERGRLHMSCRHHAPKAGRNRQDC